MLGLQHVGQLPQVAPVPLFFWLRWKGSSQDALSHICEVQVPAPLHEGVQAETPGREVEAAVGDTEAGCHRHSRFGQLRVSACRRIHSGQGAISGALEGALPWTEVWGHLLAHTDLGRVLRCFEWFRDLVDPWWARECDWTSH